MFKLVLFWYIDVTWSGSFDRHSAANRGCYIQVTNVIIIEPDPLLLLIKLEQLQPLDLPHAVALRRLTVPGAQVNSKVRILSVNNAAMECQWAVAALKIHLAEH